MQSKDPRIVYEKMTRATYELSCSLQERFWPGCSCRSDFLEKTEIEDTANVTWLVRIEEDLAGIVGTFTFDEDEAGFDCNETIWLDWFVLIPKFRGLGLGKQVLLDTIAYCASLGQYDFLRIDTTYHPERPAIMLYRKVMDLEEKYLAEPSGFGEFNYRIFSLSLHGKKIVPWCNHFLNLNG